VVEAKWDGWREIEEIESSGDREKEKEGVYPPVGKKVVHKDKEIKGIRSVPLEPDGDEGTTSD
jgi:hypothetical protein